MVYLWIVLVADDIQGTMFRDPEELLSGPALGRGVWDNQHPGARYTLQTIHKDNINIPKCGRKLRNFKPEFLESS